MHIRLAFRLVSNFHPTQRMQRTQRKALAYTFCVKEIDASDADGASDASDATAKTQG